MIDVARPMDTHYQVGKQRFLKDNVDPGFHELPQKFVAPIKIFLRDKVTNLEVELAKPGVKDAVKEGELDRLKDINLSIGHESFNRNPADRAAVTVLMKRDIHVLKEQRDALYANKPDAAENLEIQSQWKGLNNRIIELNMMVRALTPEKSK